MTGEAPDRALRGRVATEIGVVHLDAAFRIGWINRRGLEIAGQSANKLRGRRIWDIWPEILGSATEATLRHSMAERQLASLTHRHVTALGAHWLNLRCVPRPDGGLALLARDVTGARRAEAALAESNQRLSMIVARASVGLGEISLDGRFLRVNEALCALFQRDEATLTCLDVAAVTDPEDLPATLRAFVSVVESGRSASLDKRYVRPDGSRVWANSILTRLDDAAGRPRAVLAVVIDLTTRKQVEAHLIEGEARVRTLAEGIPQLVWRADAAGQVIWVSPQWVTQTGLASGDSLGAGWLEAIHPDDRAATLANWRTAEAIGLYAVEHRVATPPHGYRWCQSRAVRRQDPATGAAEWLGTSTDIEDQMRLRQDLARARDEMEGLVAARTAELHDAMQALREEVKERERAEDTLRHTQKLEAIGQLTGGIAHDFNNMLQGITGSLELAQRRIQQGRNAEVQRYLDAADDAAHRAAALTRRLLAFARRQRLDPRSLDVNLLIGDLRDLIQRSMGPGIQVKLRLEAPAGSHVRSDPSELESALLNLCINARDAMPEGGVLLLGTALGRPAPAAAQPDQAGRRETPRRDGAPPQDQDAAPPHVRDAAPPQDPGAAPPQDHVEIRIVDTGTGMAPNLLERVFEPFFTTKPLGQGTGLGLSQVYGFVNQSDGVVRIESQPGQGTTVRLWLPCIADTGHQMAPDSIQPAPGASRSGMVVLLVDDEDAVRMPAAERLRELGYLVVEAEDGASALIQAGRLARLDMLVTDVGLPGGMNGRQVAEQIGQRWPHLPVLFITGYAGPVLPAGIDVLDKPFQIDALAHRVQAALRAAG